MTMFVAVADPTSNGLPITDGDQSVTLSSAANRRCSGGESNQ